MGLAITREYRHTEDEYADTSHAVGFGRMSDWNSKSRYIVKDITISCHDTIGFNCLVVVKFS